MRVLLLGGTGEARDLAAALTASGIEVVSSLAGRVRRPRVPAGDVRVGGFGGVPGLLAELAGYDVVVDATHPFAATISASAAQACAQSGTPLVRLVRPSWASLPGACSWHWVDSHEEAASAVADGPVFLTTGRQTLSTFVGPLADRSVLVRVVDPVELPLPSAWTVVEARGPYSVDGERTLMRRHHIAVLVTKDSGGALTQAKLDAAGELGVRVVVVRRPPGPVGVPQVGDVSGAVDWLRGRRG